MHPKHRATQSGLHLIGRIAGILLISACVCPAPTLAQDSERRCGGYPSPSAGLSGLVIGYPGSPCYGVLFEDPPPGTLLESVRVRTAPDPGSFRLTGPRTFEFAPSAEMQRRAEAVLDVVWRKDGELIPRVLRFDTTTEGSEKERQLKPRPALPVGDGEAAAERTLARSAARTLARKSPDPVRSFKHTSKVRRAEVTRVRRRLVGSLSKAGSARPLTSRRERATASSKRIELPRSLRPFGS